MHLSMYLHLAGLIAALTVIPPPNGTYGVSLIDLQFTDASRADPYTGAPGRRVPISLMAPSGPASECNKTVQVYMSNATAHYWGELFGAEFNVSLSNVFSQAALSLCQPGPPAQDYPLILLSPGEGISRQFYNILGSNIAAQGFAVATVDASSEVDFLTYPDGSVESANHDLTSDAEHMAVIDIRVQDFNFVVESLSTQFIGINTSSVVVIGHSLGGGAAVEAMLQDDRYVGGADLDGGMKGVTFNKTLDKPLLILTRDYSTDLNQNSSFQPQWAPNWPKLIGPKWEIELVGALHNFFDDVPILAKYLGLYEDPAVKGSLGTTDPDEGLATEVAVLSTLAGYLIGQKRVDSIVDVAKTFNDTNVVQTDNLE